MAYRNYIAFALLGTVQSAGAHHAFAPHYDVNKPVVISGTVIEYEQRNPHAYVHVSAVDENGLTSEYICESHGVVQLSRNGIRPDMLTPGTRVSLAGSQARRDPYECSFNTVEFEDGRVLSVNGPRAANAASARRQDQIERSDIFGT